MLYINWETIPRHHLTVGKGAISVAFTCLL